MEKTFRFDGGGFELPKECGPAHCCWTVEIDRHLDGSPAWARIDRRGFTPSFEGIEKLLKYLGAHMRGVNGPVTRPLDRDACERACATIQVWLLATLDEMWPFAERCNVCGWLPNEEGLFATAIGTAVCSRHRGDPGSEGVYE